MKTDPVLLEILSNALVSITEEVGYTIKRIAHSLFIREADDFACALIDLNGRVFAYPRRVGVTVFTDLNCAPAIQAVPNLEPGDVIVTNHPYLSKGMSTHLPDINFIVPYFHEGEIICYCWLFAHFSDLGGRVPGSISPSNTDVHQEGILIPPMKICSRGKFIEDTLALINANSRTPASNTGDIRAVLAAQLTAETRVADLVRKHGVEAFLQVQSDLLEYSARRAREVFRTIPDGSYDFWDYMDDDYLSNIPIRIRAKLTVRDGLVELDFSGTDPQSLAPYNIASCGLRNYWLTEALVAYVLTHDKTVLLNAGLFEPISVKTQSGSLVDSVYPAPVGIRAVTAFRVRDVTFGALHKAVPDRMPAPPSGSTVPIVFSEPASDDGGQKIIVAQWCGSAMGARNGFDGVDGRNSNSNMTNNPLETVEDVASLVVEQYGVRPDSGGPGKWRGGAGVQITLRALMDGCQVLARNSDRFRFQPWGVHGGRAGRVGRMVVNIGTDTERDVGKIDVLTLGEGETVTLMLPGGGGYGDPFERDVQLVLRDVTRRLVSVEAARSDYGVVIRDGAVDREATAAVRASSPRPADGPYDFGDQRRAWESVCDDATMTSLVDALSSLRPEQRWHRRKTLFERVFPELKNRNVAFTDIIKDVDGKRQELQREIAAIAAGRKSPAPDGAAAHRSAGRSRSGSTSG